jgi:DNA-binding MarR family transcriptional regulator
MAGPPNSGRHPTVDLDDTAHQRVRLGVLAILTEADRVAFSYLRDTLRVSDGNLSAHLGVLNEAGLIRIDKAFVENRPRTWVRATARGRSTFASELAALKELVARYDRA